MRHTEIAVERDKYEDKELNAGEVNKKYDGRVCAERVRRGCREAAVQSQYWDIQTEVKRKDNDKGDDYKVLLKLPEDKNRPSVLVD